MLSIAKIIFVASANTALLIIAGVRVLPGPLVGSLFLAPGAMSLEGEYLRLTKRSKWGARVEVPFIILSYFIVIQSPLTYFLVAGLPLREEIPLILSEPLYLHIPDSSYDAPTPHLLCDSCLEDHPEDHERASDAIVGGHVVGCD